MGVGTGPVTSSLDLQDMHCGWMMMMMIIIMTGKMPQLKYFFCKMLVLFANGCKNE